MIKLSVAEYCHDCPEFKPEVIKSQPIYDAIGNYVGMLDPMLVVCEQRNTCCRFKKTINYMEYLQKRLAKEKGENVL